LKLKILVSILFEQFLGIAIDRRLDFKFAGITKFDAARIAEHKAPASGVLIDRVVHQAAKLLHNQILRNKTGTVNAVYVPGEDFLATPCELDYLNEQFGDIICYQ
jgi:hypothetical protein